MKSSQWTLIMIGIMKKFDDIYSSSFLHFTNNLLKMSFKLYLSHPDIWQFVSFPLRGFPWPLLLSLSGCSMYKSVFFSHECSVRGSICIVECVVGGDAAIGGCIGYLSFSESNPVSFVRSGGYASSGYITLSAIIMSQIYDLVWIDLNQEKLFLHLRSTSDKYEYQDEIA